MRSRALEKVLRELRAPRRVRYTTRKMAAAARRLGAGLSENTWKAIVLSLVARALERSPESRIPSRS